jgi:LmbE family N-acetylglucosaminyl deacetylase
MTLPALPEDSFQRVLCVVAHPDDMEYGTSAAVARWTALGIEVGYLLLTRGEAGLPNPPEETARLRVAEQEAACSVVGVKHLTVLDHPDGVLVYGLDLRRDICREIRRFKPDAVLTSGHEIKTPYGFNQADHRVAGLATLDAIRDAGNRWVFPEQIDDEELEPHSPRWLLVPAIAGFGATHGVDITGEPLSRGVASLEAHAAYIASLPHLPAPAEMIPMFTAMNGKAMGVDNAVLFRAHDLKAPPKLVTEATQD